MIPNPLLIVTNCRAIVIYSIYDDEINTFVFKTDLCCHSLLFNDSISCLGSWLQSSFQQFLCQRTFSFFLVCVLDFWTDGILDSCFLHPFHLHFENPLNTMTKSRSGSKYKLVKQFISIEPQHEMKINQSIKKQSIFAFTFYCFCEIRVDQKLLR